MPRKPRRITRGSIYHLISRFVDREWFISSSKERSHYLSLLSRALTESDWRCLSYAVMSNHIHLQTVAGERTLSSWIRRVHSGFADEMNRRHDRIGSVFVRGPKAFLVPDVKVATVMAYIHNNPVRAGVVSTASESDWTSHRAYAGLVHPPPWLHVDEGLERAKLSAADFDSFARMSSTHAIGSSDDEQFDELELEEAIEPDAKASVDVNALVRLVANTVGVSVGEMCSRRRQADHVLARHVVAHCGDRLGLSGTAVAQALGTSQQCVSKILTQTGLRGAERDIVEVVLSRLAGTG